MLTGGLIKRLRESTGYSTEVTERGHIIVLPDVELLREAAVYLEYLEHALEEQRAATKTFKFLYEFKESTIHEDGTHTIHPGQMSLFDSVKENQ